MSHANVAVFIPDLGCIHRCVFCNQKAITARSKAVTTEEIDRAVQTAQKSGADPACTELAFFGGSFTCIDRAQMLAYLRHAQQYIRRGLVSGIRVSTRPDGIDEERLSLLRQYGVTAIELGCQSMDDGVLLQCERGHTVQTTKRAARLVRDYGFSLGVQMMTGLPGSSAQSDLLTAQALIALMPDTARIYPTLVFPDTKLFEMYRAGTYRPQTLPDAVALCSELLVMFERAGVRVIRLGLHSDDGARACVAGPFHPAFRELCVSRIYFAQSLRILRQKPAGSYVLFVGPRFLSQAVGQNKENIRKLSDCGYTVRFRTDEALKQYEVRQEITL